MRESRDGCHRACGSCGQLIEPYRGYTCCDKCDAYLHLYQGCGHAPPGIPIVGYDPGYDAILCLPCRNEAAEEVL